MSLPLPVAFDSRRTTVCIRVTHSPYQACLPGGRVARRGNRLVHVDVTAFNRVAMQPSSLSLKILDVAFQEALIIAATGHPELSKRLALRGNSFDHRNLTRCRAGADQDTDYADDPEPALHA